MILININILADIGFDARGKFCSFSRNGFGKHVIIFGADMSSLLHIDNKKIDILILGKGAANDLDHTTLIAEKKYINFTEQQEIFSLHYNKESSCLFVNHVEIYKFKAKDSEINAAPSCLSNVSKDFSIDTVKKTGLYVTCCRKKYHPFSTTF